MGWSEITLVISKSHVLTMVALCDVASLVDSNLNGVAFGFGVFDVTMDLIISIKLSGNSCVFFVLVWCRV